MGKNEVYHVTGEVCMVHENGTVQVKTMIGDKIFVGTLKEVQHPVVNNGKTQPKVIVIGAGDISF